MNIANVQEPQSGNASKTFNSPVGVACCPQGDTIETDKGAKSHTGLAA
jgi:hypothetical protein